MIYLDHNATTPCLPEVVAAMLPYFSEKFGNASSMNYPLAWVSDEGIKQTRETIANYLGCIGQEIIFTAGATESINLAIRGVWDHYQTKGKQFITCLTEHSAVLETLKDVEKEGAIIHYVSVNHDGQIDMSHLEQLINDETILIAIMHANNETGVIQDAASIGKLAKSKQVFFLCDATQTFGKMPLDVNSIQADLIPFSAHKFYGPKGVGGLYIRRKGPRVNLKTQITGGHQERNLRAGTYNTPGIVGMGKALEIAIKEMDEEKERLLSFQQELEQQLLAIYPNAIINGGKSKRHYNTTNISFVGIKAESLISKLNQQIAFTVGSACNANQNKPSHVLTAMQLDTERIKGSIRLSYGRLNTKDQIQEIINLFDSSIKLLQTSTTKL